MAARRASTTAVLAVVGGVLLITLLVAWAASIGPGEVLRGHGPSANTNIVDPSPSEFSPPNDPLEDQLSKAPKESTVLEVLAWAFMLAVAVGILFGLFVLVRAGLTSWQARRRPDPRPEDVEFDVLDAPDVLARELADGASAQRDALTGGTPRNAIVEVWHRFETLAGNVGAVRRPWETSSEFTLRVLDAVDADSSAMARLAALYREARFSDHELTEDDRVAALAALDSIHAGLRSGGRAARS
jgi:Domain of unknown function (DUF4129)